ncbi:MAG: SAM-dependent methyltransferase [Clostridiales bacterium]|nr:SAM-dependent methyltransferase [Clostridiales bacterium]
MRKLSERLQVMADNTMGSKTVADVGSDHGFLSINLMEEGLSERVIVTDVSRHSLDKAVANCREELADVSSIEFRCGDGLTVLGRGEADAVVIGGMGGRLIRDIMALDLEHACSFRKFVLQPRIGQGRLRNWLCEKGFQIVREDVVKEGRYIPEIITAISPEFDIDEEPLNYGIDLSELDGDDIICKVPPWIIKAHGPVLGFLYKNIERESNTLNNVQMSKIRYQVYEEKLRSNIKYLEELVKEMKNG